MARVVFKRYDGDGSIITRTGVHPDGAITVPRIGERVIISGDDGSTNIVARVADIYNRFIIHDYEAGVPILGASEVIVYLEEITLPV